MEDVKQLSYDLDTIYNDVFLSIDHSVSLPVPLPTKDEVALANRVLTNQIAAMVKRSNDISVHYGRVIKWWDEYETLVQAVQELVREGENRLNQLLSRVESKACPRENPNNLLKEAQVCYKDM